MGWSPRERRNKMLDPNLVKIRDTNIALIKRNLLGRPIIQAKSYLLHVMGENRMDEINDELDQFVAHMKTMYQDYNKVQTQHA
jgi:hypothetical protein